MIQKSGPNVSNVRVKPLKKMSHFKKIQKISAVNCSEPPEKPGAGTWQWNGSFEYKTRISYTCGPYGNFLR